MTPIENRPTGGTTVTVYFCRESRNWCDKIDSFAIRYMIACLALVNKEVILQFSVRGCETTFQPCSVGIESYRQLFSQLLASTIKSKV